MALTDKLTAIANAIRGKTGKTDALTLEQMPGEIEGIETDSTGYSINDIIENKIIKIEYDGTYIPNYKFYGEIGLTEVYLENITYIRQSVFQVCTNLQKAYLPKVNKLDMNCFEGCKSLSEIHAPEVNYIGMYAFRNNEGIKKIDFPKLTTIINAAFSGMKNLEALILRSDTLIPIGSTNVLFGTPIASGTGYIYVPQSLLEEYKIATNWSIFADQFVAIEGSEYE